MSVLVLSQPGPPGASRWAPAWSCRQAQPVPSADRAGRRPSGVASRGDSRLLPRLREQAAPKRPTQARTRTRLEEQRGSVLVLSQPMPAGRVPVMPACLLARVPAPRFTRGGLP